MRRLVWLSVLAGGLAAGCELIAGLQDRQLESDGSVDSSTEGGPGCLSPRMQCMTADASVCVDTTNDINHCGGCSRTCSVADAGSFDATSGNPDPGIPALADAGSTTYVHVPGPGCEAGTCELVCSPGSELCGSLCYDTQNLHDHCGSCTNACDAGDWCHGGACCPPGQESCGDAGCIDVVSNDNNCGACGVHCEGGTPTCIGGACGTGVVFTEAFVAGSGPPAYCTDWNNFRAQLTGTYTSITVRGTFDPVGHTCTGPSANTLCQALHNGTTTGAIVCNGNTWGVGLCGGAGYVELNAKDDVICMCQTTNPTNYYDLRPCNGVQWGGVNTATCTPQAPTQTDTVICQ